jgi:nucleoside-diphosphate-sugar epimerase
MACLITGGTGLVASRIARRLAETGKEVVIYDYSPDKDMLEMVIDEKLRPKVKVVKGDILDYDFLAKTIKENNVDSIFHYAAILGDAIKENPCWASKVNVEGTLNCFEAARVLKLKKVVWASSNAVFPTTFPTKLPKEFKPDDYVYYPWGLYGAAKLFGENAAEYYFQQYGVDITAVRYGPLLFGAGQKRGKSGEVIQELVLNPALGKPAKVPYGDDTMLWLYAEDAARAAVLASQTKRTKVGAYNIGGHSYSVKELFNYVKKLLPEAQMELLPGPYNGPCYNFDTALTEKELGFRPQYSVHDGIKESINMMRKHYGLPLIKF